MQLKANLLRDVLHHAVVGKDVRDDTAELFLAADLNEKAQQLCAETVALPLIADDDCPFGFI